MRIPNRFPNRPNRNLTAMRLGGNAVGPWLRRTPNRYYHFIPYTPPPGAQARARVRMRRGGLL